MGMLKDLSDEEKPTAKWKDTSRGGNPPAEASGGGNPPADDGEDPPVDPGPKAKRWFDAARVRANLQRAASLALEKKVEEAVDVAKMLETSVSSARVPVFSACVVALQ
jgi:hypothetical protein